MSNSGSNTTCAEGITLCDDPRDGQVCVDLKSNDNYCGNCGSHCREGFSCVNGECLPN